MPRKKRAGGESPGGLIRGLNRFDYWRHIPRKGGRYPSEDDLWEPFKHRMLSDRARNLHRLGNQEAIFEYVREDIRAFRADWVQRQIEQWRKENTPRSRKNLRRLMHAYSTEGESGRGTRMGLPVLDKIEQDARFVIKTAEILRKDKLPSIEQAINHATMPQGSTDRTATQPPASPLSSERAREIWNIYREALLLRVFVGIDRRRHPDDINSRHSETSWNNRFQLYKHKRHITASRIHRMEVFCRWSLKGVRTYLRPAMKRLLPWHSDEPEEDPLHHRPRLP